MMAEHEERLLNSIFAVLTDEEKVRIYMAYANSGTDMSEVDDIKSKYGLSLRNLRRIAKECGPEITPQARYDKDKTRMVSIKLNKKTDADILEKIDAADNIGQFIRQSIRAYGVTTTRAQMLAEFRIAMRLYRAGEKDRDTYRANGVSDDVASMFLEQ